MSYLSNASELAREAASFEGGRVQTRLCAIDWNDEVGVRLKQRILEITDGELYRAKQKAKGITRIDTEPIERAILAAEAHLREG